MVLVVVVTCIKFSRCLLVVAWGALLASSAG